MIDPHDMHFNDYMPISTRLANALQIPLRDGHAQRFRVGYALAENMDISTEHLEGSGLLILLELVPHLEPAVAQTSAAAAAKCLREAGSLITDFVGELGVDRQLQVLRQFGWDRFSPPLRAESVTDLWAAVDWHLQQPLISRVHRMFDMWRLRGWSDADAPKAESRLVRSAPRRAAAS